MPFLIIDIHNRAVASVGLPAGLMVTAMKALGARDLPWNADGYALIEGEFQRPVPVATCQDPGTCYGIVPLRRGLSARLVRPATTGGYELIDFGLTPRGMPRFGPAGTVNFEDEQTRVPPEVLRWLEHGERGLSSDALCRALYGTPQSNHGPEYWPHPLDPDDLRRALLFLDNFPDARHHLDLITAKSPQWAALVEHWDELDTLMRKEAPTGKCPKTYELMQALLAPLH